MKFKITDFENLKSIEGIVNKAIATQFTVDGRVSTFIKLENDDRTYQLVDQTARIDVGERIKIYYSNECVGASENRMVGVVEILDEQGNTKFAYVDYATRID